MLRKIATKSLLIAGKIWGRFITVHTRPIYTKDMPYQGKENPVDGACAIVIQGPIKREYDFTVESVKLYRKHYPSATIILSTWKDEDVSAFETFKGEKFKVVQSEKPPYRGACNVNMQIVSTSAGIEEAFKLGFKYVAKTRTDQRMYGIGSLQFLINMTECFPVVKTSAQQKRIIATNMGTSKIRPYHFADLFMFGEISDMRAYWTPPLEMDRTINSRDFLAEGYLFTNFLKKTGWDIKGNLEDTMKALGERCIVVNNESVDVYWPKYAALWREYRLRNYFSPTLEISFKTWLNEAFIPALQSKDEK